MPPLLSVVERALERAFEGPVRRLFRPRLQPVEIARAIGRAMERDAQVAPGGLLVPNHYVVALHPQDFQAVAAQHAALERDLALYVQQRAVARGWRCAGRPRVELCPAPAVPRGRPAVQARACDAGEPPAVEGFSRPTLWATDSDSTQLLASQPAAAPPPPPGAAEAWLTLPDGRRCVLHRPLVRLGRAPDNDVVIPDARVSRYHAQIHCRGALFTLVDLGSTNGTRVDTEPVTERVLQPGDTIYLGGVPVRFEVRR
jgi:hypothetical protein